ncbi:MAG: hypothetical protein KKF52_05535, partial [Nanoarchaeota archaeon]|nr:hypothetical protein [Nanoarchaeota archaeon]
GLTGVIGSAGEVSKKIGNALADKKDSKSAKCLEGAVDSGLAFAMLNNDSSRQFVRDHLLYKWDMYSNNVEGGLETIAGLSTVAFTIALVYTMVKGSVDKLEDSKE